MAHVEQQMALSSMQCELTASRRSRHSPVKPASRQAFQSIRPEERTISVVMVL